MVHHVGCIAAGEIAHLGPEGSKGGDVKQAFAFPQAMLHPFVVGEQVAATPVTAIGSSTSIQGSHGVDELAQIDCERLGVSGLILVGGRLLVTASCVETARVLCVSV